MKVFKFAFLTIIYFAFNGCSLNQKDDGKSSALDSLRTSFEMRNYLKLDNIYSGPVFTDGKTGKDVFYRIVEIPSEEHLTFFVEKISIGEEGNNYQLIKRYRIEEASLSIRGGFNKLDSLIFKDSVSVLGNFNKSKFKLDLEQGTAVKQ